jgi:nucleotide-binding universal stress UspA family protein
MDEVPPRRIVVGVDGAPSSLAALRWAAGEALLRGARLHVVSVWDHTRRRIAPYARLNGRLTPNQERMTARTRLTTALRAAFGSDAPTDITAELAEGLVARVLLDRAAGAEMLVLGASAPPPRAGQTAGPVARACLGQASCPVVVVSAASRAAHESPRPSGASRMSVKGRRGAPVAGGP